MRRPRSLLALALSSALFAAAPSGRAVPGDHATDRAISLSQRILQRSPRDADAYYRLGDAYVQKARESGDVAYFDRAEQALRTALEIEPRYARARRHLAYVLYFRHDFAGAVREATRAIALAPTDSYAYGVLGDAYLETGRYDSARQAYATMARLKVDLYTLSRQAGLKSLRGDTPGAIGDLERAIADGLAAGRPREGVAWARWQLGNEYWAVGRLRAAEAEYQAALDTYPGYHRARAGLAQVRAAERRFPEAILLYQKALAVIPLPDYAAALGDVYTAIGRGDEAEKQYDLVEYIGYLSSLNKVLYNRELAYFYADHDTKPAEALALARRELTVRQDVYAHDVLAWALYKNGRPGEALPHATAALKLGTRDPKLYFHAGMIDAALGRRGPARAHLARALALNPVFHLRHAELARQTLKTLGGGRP